MPTPEELCAQALVLVRVLNELLTLTFHQLEGRIQTAVVVLRAANAACGLVQVES